MQSFPVRCPHCGKPNLIPANVAGMTLQCPLCRAAYLAPPPPLASAPAAATAGASPVAPTPRSGPLPPHLVPAAASAAPHQPDAPIEPAEFAIKPRPAPRGRKIVAPMYAFALCLLLAVAAVTTGVIVVVLDRNRPAEEEVVEWVANPADPYASAEQKSPRWTDATKAVIRDEARVKISSVEFGPVMGRNASNQPITAAGEFIKIYLKIENRGDRDLQYTSWYGNRFSEAGEQVVAELVDSSGKSWPLQQFPDLQKIQGHTPQIVLPDGERADDVLIFAGPQALLTAGRPLRLALPAAAMWRKLGPRWQVQSGFYRFEIPVGMLSGESSPDNE